MQTEPYFQKDAYLKVFDANVLAVEGQDVALDATAFYPGGGGQPHDTGILKAGDETWPVVNLRRRDDLIWHTVEGTPPQAGMSVQGVLDWEHRYALMRTHTALHILCGV
ncbi:MAG: alanine--tRNA ligase-related protein, partial [Anaerolineae bacterium]